MIAALAEHRVRLQAAIGRQARLRRTPELHFGPDNGIRDGWKVEQILTEIGPLPADEDSDDDADDADPAVDTTIADGSGMDGSDRGADVGTADGGADGEDMTGGTDQVTGRAEDLEEDGGPPAGPSH